MRSFIVTVAILLGVTAIAVGAFALVGPDRIWRSFGEPDLGTVAFDVLQRRTTPNDALACPPESCNAQSELLPPVFAADAGELRQAFAKMIATEPRVERVSANDQTLTDRYIQRTPRLGFPDTIVVKFFDRTTAAGTRSTLALYSRSQIGEGDLGVNRARLERWLGKLRTQLPVVVPAAKPAS